MTPVVVSVSDGCIYVLDATGMQYIHRRRAIIRGHSWRPNSSLDLCCSSSSSVIEMRGGRGRESVYEIFLRTALGGGMGGAHIIYSLLPMSEESDEGKDQGGNAAEQESSLSC